ncbi:MAG: serine/threonine-protein kinase PknK, partial [Anaerolineae bacterium]|nr:serine/threonine-protein kinase PknK [Anaerolineae bacterium]
MDDLTGQTIKGYQLHQCIGKGGFGAVYRAFQPVIEREVAVKVILPQYANNPEFIRRFETEAQLVARLEHPHIVPLYDFWREPDSAYLVMRYVRAGSLRGVINQKSLDDRQYLWLFEQIAAALAIAHHNGVIHQDIKPENILLDENSNAYLTDFGIAKVIGETRNEEEGVSGSPAYFSPEQIRSEDVSPLADIYALGMMLYELATHVHPYAGLTPSEMIMKHLQEPLPDVRLVRPELPAAFNYIIQKATAKEPKLRYPDTIAMVVELRQAILGRSSVPSVQDIDLIPVVNPYKGLRAFEEADALDFFGREDLTERLLGRLREQNQYMRFLAVVGPSGSGKSSVVKAGLLPALRNETIPGSNRWFFVEMVPGNSPLRNLETALRSVAAKPPTHLLAQLEADSRGLLWAVDRVLADVDGDLV